MDVKSASEVSVSSLVYDHPELTKVFLLKLQNHGNFDLVLVVDKESFEAQPPHAPQQKTRLRALQRAGAKVVLCSGTGRYGRMHGKALVCDRRVAYCGSANFTSKSVANEELCFRLVGPSVVDVFAFTCRAEQKGKLWH